MLYRRGEVREAAGRADPIFVTEGEKDADAVRALGHWATTNVRGAGQWRDRYAADLAGASQVIVVADRDAAGRAHARRSPTRRAPWWTT